MEDISKVPQVKAGFQRVELLFLKRF